MFHSLKEKALEKEMNNFIFFSQKKWPRLRLKYKQKMASRCKLCINTEYYSSLNKEGICQECESISAGIKQNAGLSQKLGDQKQCEELKNLITSQQGKGDHYDAMILFSGGKDSIFILKELTEQFKQLRILAFTLDNGFMSPYALNNIHSILDKRKQVDFLFFKTSLFKKIIAYILTHLPDDTGYSLVDHYDGYLTFDIARYIADSFNIPLVFAGLNYPQAYEYFHSEWECLPEKELQARKKILTLDVSAVINAKEKSFWKPNYKQHSRCKLLFPLAAWKTDEIMIQKEIIAAGLSSVSATHKLNFNTLHPLITNSRFLSLLWLLDYKKFGYSTTEPKVSEMIRSGKSDRAFWLNNYQAIEYLAKRDSFLNLNINQLLEELNLTHADVGLCHIGN
ncbi:hypothetical protein ACNVED_16115 (plasmid) [Legionella sp. D16C41]|uniref:hypothetical protein n=1 Tax=Legionella sp. D16C41 TaxID=3402688 RepID=UPI003AF63FEB